MNKKEAPKNLIWVEDLRKRLVMPGREKPISPQAARALINKWTRDRTIVGAGPGKKAFIPKTVADAVYEYFARKHGIPL